MAGNTQIAIPDNIDDKVVLRRVLDSIVQSLDELKGVRGEGKAATESQLTSTATSLDELRDDFNKLDLNYVRLDGKGAITGPLTYSTTVEATGNTLVSYSQVEKAITAGLLEYVKKNSATAPAQLAGNADLATTVAKVNELINVLKSVKILS